MSREREKRLGDKEEKEKKEKHVFVGVCLFFLRPRRRRREGPKDEGLSIKHKKNVLGQ